MSEVKRPTLHYLNDFEKEELNRNFPAYKEEGWVQVGDKKYCFPARYVKDFDIYYNFEVEPDDTWIVSYPRTGSTWTQELVWLIKNDLDFTTAKESFKLHDRVVFFDFSLIVPNWLSLGKQSHELAQEMKKPRFIKTHFPLELLPNVLKSDSKVVYVARNPKDTIVSLYHFYKERHCIYEGDFEQFWNHFEHDHMFWSPYWEHLKEAWRLRDKSNFLFLFYEDMKYDLIYQAKRVAQFFDKSYSDDQYKKLEQYLSIDNLKNNEKKVKEPLFFKKSESEHTGHFRKGQTQNWHELFSTDLNEKANRWIKENLKDSDIYFPHVDIYA